MSCLDAEMRHIDNRRRVIGPKLDLVTGGERLKPLAQLQDGQGAQKAPGIEDYWFGHGDRHLGAMFQRVHRLVTEQGGDAIGRPA